MAKAAELLGDRWSLLIIRELFYGVHKFEAIRQDISIPKSVLSSRLATMTEAGIVEKHPYKPEGARTRYEYHLTSAGKGLAVSLLALLEWGNKHREIDGVPFKAIDRSTGNRAVVRVVDAQTGIPVKLRNLDLVEDRSS
ncbi:winged helix-turn-helix transcriptional regulator [Aliiroseovarius marinus]|uniref:winged helix-turn-helix transcriptional regulator n=1 Tax=Aliiroseovarius marinus TaxID=2500159 RepID=UPI003D7D617F